MFQSEGILFSVEKVADCTAEQEHPSHIADAAIVAGWYFLFIESIKKLVRYGQAILFIPNDSCAIACRDAPAYLAEFAIVDFDIMRIVQ